MCNNCKNFAKSVAVFLDGTDMIIVIPTATYETYGRICLCIAQSIPATSTATPVFVQLGYTATPVRFPLLSNDGTTPIYSYQLRCRRKYEAVIGADSASLIVQPRQLEFGTTVLTAATGTNATTFSTTRAAKTKTGVTNE